MKIDTEYLQEVQSNPQYDYLSEINQEQPQKLTSSYRHRPYLSDRDQEAVQTIGAVLIILLLLFALWRFGRRLFLNVEKDDASKAGLGTDTIYGHDWDQEIRAFMADGQYGEAVVLCYLRWLNTLQAAKVIKFHKSKTPGIFLNEANAYTHVDKTAEELEALRSKTLTLTNHYLQVRYGHRQPSLQLANTLIAL